MNERHLTLPPCPPTGDLYTHLKDVSDRGKPILLYGMGNGADKILRETEKRGIPVADVFASDGFVRGHSFHGKRVLSYTEAKERYGSFTVLLSFGTSLPDVIGTICRVAEEQELFAPDMPVAGETVFDRDFYTANIEKIRRAYRLFSDEISKEIYLSVLNYKLTGNIRYLLDAPEDEGEDLFPFSGFRCCVDAGAYHGESSEQLLSLCPRLRRVYALEPDRRNYAKLKAFADRHPLVTAICAGAWSDDGDAFFSSQGNRNSAFRDECPSVTDSHTVLTKRVKIDTIAVDETVDYIKYDVEGCEEAALTGSRKTILRCRPSLRVSVYHRTEDLFALPLLLSEMAPDHALYLRRKRYLPAWDVTLCAIPR